MDRASRQYLYDIDGNRYIDYIGSWGPMILGHAHPEVLDAIQQAAARAHRSVHPPNANSGLAALIQQIMPSMERVRLVSSGTEAVMSAIRVARVQTGREKVIKFSGCYHDTSTRCWCQRAQPLRLSEYRIHPVLHARHLQDTIVLNYNDCDSLKRVFEELPTSIAAVILEPVVATWEQ